MAKLKDTSASGAVFFAVCRGKVCLVPFQNHSNFVLWKTPCTDLLRLKESIVNI